MNNQIFVKIDEYDEVLKLLKIVDDKIAKAEQTIEKISEMRKEEEQEIENWTKSLTDVKVKVGDIEKEFKIE